MKRILTVRNDWILKCVTSRWGVIGHHGQKVASNCHVSNSIARCSIRCNTPWQGPGETGTLLGSCLVWKKAQWLLKCIHMDVPYDAAILCLSVHPKEMYTLSNVKTRARVDCTVTNCDQHLISRCTLWGLSVLWNTTNQVQPTWPWTHCVKTMTPSIRTTQHRKIYKIKKIDIFWDVGEWKELKLRYSDFFLGGSHQL